MSCHPWATKKMFEISLALSEDRTEARIQLPSMGGPQKMSADELSELIRHLTQLGRTWPGGGALAYETIPRPKSRWSELPTLNLRRRQARWSRPHQIGGGEALGEASGWYTACASLSICGFVVRGQLAMAGRRSVSFALPRSAISRATA